MLMAHVWICMAVTDCNQYGMRSLPLMALCTLQSHSDAWQGAFTCKARNDSPRRSSLIIRDNNDSYVTFRFCQPCMHSETGTMSRGHPTANCERTGQKLRHEGRDRIRRPVFFINSETGDELVVCLGTYDHISPIIYHHKNYITISPSLSHMDRTSLVPKPHLRPACRPQSLQARLPARKPSLRPLIAPD